MKSREEIEALLLEVLPALPAELLADGEALREHLGVFPSTGELVDELATTLTLLHSHAPDVPELSAGFTDSVMAALPEAPATVVSEGPVVLTGGGAAGSAAIRWGWRAAAAAACFALGMGFSHWQAGPATQPGSVADQTPSNPIPQAPETQAPQDAAPQDLEAAPDLRGRDPWQGAVAQQPQYVNSPYSSNPVLGEYASDAQQVLHSLDRLDERTNPRALNELVLTVRSNRLVVRGEALLAELEVGPAGSGEVEHLERLIHGTQVILRRVRNARGPAAVTTLREEVRTTGLLDAYNTLLAPADEQEPQAAPPIQSTGPL